MRPDHLQSVGHLAMEGWVLVAAAENHELQAKTVRNASENPSINKSPTKPSTNATKEAFKNS